MNRHILVVDCGSTGIRSIIINSDGRIISRNYKKLEIIHTDDGGTENNPEMIWTTFRDMVIKAINKPFINIDSIAITNQRSTFTFWDKKTGKPLINFINWQDIRAAQTARSMNKNPLWLSLRTVSFVIGRLIRNPLLIVTSMLRLNTDHTICKVKWVLDNNKKIQKLSQENRLMFGTIDTWLLYKLTGEKVHATDYTNAAATSMLNPFILKWNKLFCRIFKIPMNMLPKVFNTNGFFGNTSKNIFGKSIPITAIVGDQQASLFGHRCFNAGDLKITLGSGAFITMNVGKKPKFSTKGLFPMIGWALSNKTEYILEGQVATLGTFIDWAVQKLKLFESPQELDSSASEVNNSEGVFCIPTLTGIRFPYFKPGLKCSFSGISLKTEKKHIAYAIIDGLANRTVDIVEGMEHETGIKIPNIKIDGGASNSDILVQRIADLTGKKIYRSVENDLASIGAAYLAGLSTGMWKDEDEILNMNIPQNCFKPILSSKERIKCRSLWKDKVLLAEKIYKK